MIRLAVVTVLLAVGVVVVRRRQAKGPAGDVLRVASRTGISRGVMAAVLEVEHRRFLVTITPTSTTLVAELGPTGAPLPATTLDAGPSYDVARPEPTPVAPAPAASLDLIGPLGPALVATAAPTVPVFSVAPVAPVPAATPETAADGTFLDRLRARTVRTYDPALVAALRAER